MQQSKNQVLTPPVSKNRCSLVEEIRQVRSVPVLTVRGVQPCSNQRGRRGPAARHSQHPGPTSTPRVESGPPQQRWCLPGPSSRQTRHEVDRFVAPSATRLNGDDNQVAARAGQKFVVLHLFVSHRCPKHGAIHVRSVALGVATRSECAPQCHVDCQLGPVMQREASSEHLDGALVTGRHCDVHVSELGVGPDRGACFAAQSGHGSFGPNRSRAKSS